MTSTLRPRSIQSDHIAVQDVEAETLIYDERSHKAWCLNHSSACIWRLCDGQNTIVQIAAIAATELGSPITEDLVLLTLAELTEKGLLLPEAAEFLPQGYFAKANDRQSGPHRSGVVACDRRSDRSTCFGAKRFDGDRR